MTSTDPGRIWKQQPASPEFMRAPLRDRYWHTRSVLPMVDEDPTRMRCAHAGAPSPNKKWSELGVQGSVHSGEAGPVQGRAAPLPTALVQGPAGKACGRCAASLPSIHENPARKSRAPPFPFPPPPGGHWHATQTKRKALNHQGGWEKLVKQHVFCGCSAARIRARNVPEDESSSSSVGPSVHKVKTIQDKFLASSPRACIPSCLTLFDKVGSLPEIPTNHTQTEHVCSTLPPLTARGSRTEQKTGFVLAQMHVELFSKYSVVDPMPRTPSAGREVNSTFVSGRKRRVSRKSRLPLNTGVLINAKDVAAPPLV